MVNIYICDVDLMKCTRREECEENMFVLKYACGEHGEVVGNNELLSKNKNACGKYISCGSCVEH